jgi:hypothetical protein
MLAKQLVDQLIAQHWKTIEQAAVAAASTLSLAGFKSKPMYEEWPIYPKGMGMVCVAQNGIKANELIAEYFGEVYPPWRWFEVHLFCAPVFNLNCDSALFISHRKKK